ncbi:AsmA-like C-terminal region-containing protein [Persicirhabdus sediminis]|uniref:AsmA-like C-terminal region n=1 Tax=Persicirhabdus sediminis TaxID=454144 RepID=A0A8J7MCI1_9BACT|nr:AsmA-like C-terminal region-containing protein [Persicirhabdus sediminis]MBK1790632.1 hypothetical protein [Persicirhabdus sediminis]
MFIKRLLRQCRLCLFLAGSLIVVLVVAAMVYYNEVGLDEKWRTKIAAEIEQLGIVADFDNVHYDPSRGLVAKGVTIYEDATREVISANMASMIIDIDKSKLMRGEGIRVNKLHLRGVHISLAVDPADPSSEHIDIHDLKGNIYLPEADVLQANSLSGYVSGINIQLDAKLWGRKFIDESKPASEKDVVAHASRLRLITETIKELKQWHWPDESPPVLKVFVEGNLTNPQDLRVDLEIIAKELNKGDRTLRDVLIRGDFKNQLITVDQLAFKFKDGQLKGQADYHMATKRGRFIADSSIDLEAMLEEYFGLEIELPVVLDAPPNIHCSGDFTIREGQLPDLRLVGRFNDASGTILKTEFDAISGDVSWKSNGDVYITNLQAKRLDGELSGRCLHKNGKIRFEFDSTLPYSSFNPLLASIKSEKGQQALSRAKLGKKSKIHLKASGEYDLHNKAEWLVSGRVQLDKFAYKKVDLHHASADFDINPTRLIFDDINIRSDHRDYKLYKKWGGPSSGKVTADQVEVNFADKMVHIKNANGTVWPAPIVRLFHTKVADHIEQYRFHHPPSLSANGSFDLVGPWPKTDFFINVKSKGITDYKLLGEDVPVRGLSGKVHITQGRVDVTKLDFVACQGSIEGNINVKTTNPKLVTYKGNFHGERIHLGDIGRIYDFDANQGLITGNIEFSGAANDIRKFNGSGDAGLENGNLFSIPMLGPLSPLIGGILNDKDIAREQVENASMSFVIRDGIIYSNDFIAASNTIKFTGEGNIDMKTKVVDATMRMNAKGPLGILMIPLKPFAGLFQFQGSGTLSSAKWRAVVFSSPKKGKNDPIFSKAPKAQQVRE